MRAREAEDGVQQFFMSEVEAVIGAYGRNAAACDTIIGKTGGGTDQLHAV